MSIEETRIRILCDDDPALRQIRHYGRDSVAVPTRLLEGLTFLAERVQREEDREAIMVHAQSISRGAATLPDELDRQLIHEQFEKLRESLQTERNNSE